jgi:hypothetical protein
MNLDELHEQLAKAAIEYHDNIRAIVQPLSDEDLLVLVKECRRLAEPTDTRNFAMPEWDLIAGIIATEHATRVSMKKATEYMEATGETSYCVHCGGACTPEHLAELD